MSKIHKNPASRGRIRIIGGRWRGRQLTFPAAPDLRPTGDRIRETLFNWLQPHLPNANCLDLFAGSGALGFEALSRGAAALVSVELNSAAVQALRANLVALGGQRCTITAADAVAWLQTTPPQNSFDIVFLDPPFASNLSHRVAHLLENNGWLNVHALIYIETPAHRAPGTPADKFPENWQPIKQKVAGDVDYRLYQRI